MTDRDAVSRFSEVVEARMWGPYPRPGRWKSMWKARLSGKDRIAELYVRLEPFLGERRRGRFQELLLGADAEERVTSWQPQRWEWFPWAAGLFEAEGCISTTGSSPRLIIVSVDEAVLKRFSSVLGGRVKGPYQRVAQSSTARNQPYFHWEVCGLTRCSEVATKIRPWLGQRRRAKLGDLVTGVRHVAGLNQVLYLEEEYWEPVAAPRLHDGNGAGQGR